MSRRRIPLAIGVLAALLLVGPLGPASAYGPSEGPMAAHQHASSSFIVWPPSRTTSGEAGILRLQESGLLYARRALVVETEFDAVRVMNHADLNPRTAMTLELWLKHRLPRGCGTLVGKNRASSYWLGMCDGRLRFEMAGRTLVESQSSISEGRWTHVAAVYQPPTARLYINGVLDRENTAARDPLAASSADLVLGADASPGLAFRGLLDHVRLWSIARTAAEIAANDSSLLSPQAGLVAQWELDGSARDSIGQHDGYVESGGAYSFDGAVPRDVTVPVTAVPITVDGRCEASEYSQAQRIAVDSADPATILVVATANDLHLCFHRMARPRSGAGVTQVYLDRNLSRDDLAQASDYRFGINQRSVMEARQGDGLGGWRDLSLPTGSWQAVQASDQESWSAEYRIPRSFIDRPARSDEPYRFGMAVAMTADTPLTAEYLWPVRALPASPRSWSVVTLAEPLGLPPRASFSGRCVQLSASGRYEGIAGATVQLFTVRQSEARLVANTLTDGGGYYRLEYRGEWPERFLVRQLDARGSFSVRAEAGERGFAVSPNLVQYEIASGETATSLEFGGTRFVDQVGLPHLGQVGPLYLVVYADPVSKDDLAALLAARQRQGFEVIVTSTAQLERVGQGRDLAERIRNWLIGHWRRAGERPVYGLLIGRADKVPIRDVGWMDSDHRQPGTSKYYPAWPTDWYYADLDSEWDGDGDGFFGELMRCKPGDKYLDPEGEKTCPESGSLLREGPYGAFRSPDDDFKPEISIGRIAANEPGEVRRAIAAVLAAESLGGTDKRRALLAGSLYSYEGRSWTAITGASVAGGAATANPWVGWPWDGNQPLGQDSASHFELRMKVLLQPFMQAIVRHYERTVPQTGLEYLAPSPYECDVALSPESIAEAWGTGRFGLMNLAGRGGPTEITSARGLHDWDRNQIIDQPAAPTTCAGQPVDGAGRVGPPCEELVARPLVDARLPAPAGSPPVVIATSARSGAVAWNWSGMDRSGNVIGLQYGPPALAGILPARGRVSAWVGSMHEVPPGWLDEFQAGVNQRLLEQGMRLGDAVWLANAELAAAEPYDIRSYGTQLFGDPAQLYWGNPLDAAGAWPQEGRDWQATSASPYVGPGLPELVWRASDSAPNSAPVIGRRGEIVVAAGDGVLRFSTNGLLIQRTTLSGATAAANRYPPAIATDGVYLAAGSFLYALDANLALREQIRLPVGATVSGAPRIGPDGAIWVPTRLGMARVAGNGYVTLLGGGEAAIGAMAVLPSGEVVWSSAGEAIHVYWIDRQGVAHEDEIAESGMRGLTAVAVAPSGQLYVGSTTGRLYALNRQGSLWQVDTGAAIQARPAVAADGSVFVGNSRGTILAYGPSGGRERWRRELGSAVRATPTLDGAMLYVTVGRELVALNVATGDVVWRIDLGGATDERSAPILGADRTIYVLRSDQTLVAVREAGWLPAPTDVRVTAGPDRVTVDWRDNASDETGYRVELCHPDGWCFATTDVAANATRATLRRLPVAAGTPFYARVIALGASAEDLQSTARASWTGVPAGLPMAADANWASAYGVSPLSAVLPTEPAAVKGLRAEGVYADAIRLQWRYEADPGQLEGFEIRRGLAPAGPFTAVALVDAERREYQDEGLVPATTYHYQVVALNEGGTSEPVAASATTKAETLRQPSELVATVGHESIALRWRDNATDETGYIVQRRGPGSANYETVGILGANSQSFSDSAYVLRGTYHYRVRAVGKTADSAYVLTAATLGGPRVAWLYLPFAQQRR